ncbi:MAG: Sulfatase modifying factor 1 precursor [Polyangiaceae bacterium]|jgi:formylglycine-generating enzyme required for sulfatase activity|nr:Sulfatase modifying factor 1 precursor [Polyangiaceae bacterium]
MTRGRLPAWLLVAVASQSPSVGYADGPRRVRTTASAAVYLRPLSMELGSNEVEVLAALVRCKREPLPDRCDETTFAGETPTHQERVDGFWIARTEVSVADYERCVAAGRCQSPAFEGGGLRFQQPRFPVTLVSFDDARRYCAFRGGRLPTEAEFERAARGQRRRTYPWGSGWHGKLANHGRSGVDDTDDSDGFAELAPVGSFPDGATPEGVLDLAGNVEEWTADPYAATYGTPPGSERVVRGGSYQSAAPFLRGAARTGKPPETREPTLGFRCVWPVKPVRD